MPATVVLRRRGTLLLFSLSFLKLSSFSFTDEMSTELSLRVGSPSGTLWRYAAGPVSLRRFIPGEWVGEAIGDLNMQMLLGATEAAMSIIDGCCVAFLLFLRKKHGNGLGISVFGVNSNSVDPRR